MRALLDVNVLIALLDRKHEANHRAQQWLAANSQHGWASCPLTENGCVRIMSHVKYAAPLSAIDVLNSLEIAMQSCDHEFWSDSLSLSNASVFRRNALRGHRQITDAYLLALAVHHGGRLVTFDQGIGLDIVTGAKPENLVIIPV